MYRNDDIPWRVVYPCSGTSVFSKEPLPVNRERFWFITAFREARIGRKPAVDTLAAFDGAKNEMEWTHTKSACISAYPLNLNSCVLKYIRRAHYNALSLVSKLYWIWHVAARIKKIDLATSNTKYYSRTELVEPHSPCPA
ncbi:hypothetical protein EDC04DRAFT_3098450 [Pisolithus marmoratus]|nr:hypothetical protein EDC04DRAFT_3098450 [Pisolithus marmoratus]